MGARYLAGPAISARTMVGSNARARGATGSLSAISLSFICVAILPILLVAAYPLCLDLGLSGQSQLHLCMVELSYGDRRSNVDLREVLLQTRK